MKTLVATLLVVMAFAPALVARADSGAVTVINDTEFTLEIQLDGETKCTLKPGARETIRDIPEGPHKFKAVSSNGEQKFSKAMTVIPGRTLSWYLKWTHLLQFPF